jgi:hypothetical protein
LIFDGVKEGFFATASLMATYGGASGKKWAVFGGDARGLEPAVKKTVCEMTSMTEHGYTSVMIVRRA